MSASFRSHALRCLALTACLAPTVSPAPRAAAADDVAAPSVLSFDEIDHVYTASDVPPPGSFDHDVTLVVHRDGPHRATFFQGLMRTASLTGTQLDNAGSVVGSSGAIGQALGLANDATKMAPIASAMGMAGGGHFAQLLQTYELPRISPTGAVMLSGFLAARSDVRARYPSNAHPAATAAASAGTPSGDDAYARGSLRHYTVADDGWMRIDDPDTRSAVIIEPDLGKSYAIDDAARTIHTSAYATPAPATPSPAGPSAAATVTASVDALPGTQLAHVDTVGFRTQSTIRIVTKAAGCDDLAVSSTRIEYFAPYRVAPDANSAPAASMPSDTCVAARRVVRRGPEIPRDRLLVYQSNAVEKRTAAGTDRYTLVIERGNVRAMSSAARSAFDLPTGYREI